MSSDMRWYLPGLQLWALRGLAEGRRLVQQQRAADAVLLPTSELHTKIVEQVDFYFGASAPAALSVYS